MSRFYGEVRSDTGKSRATRRGFKTVTAHIRGWDAGVEVIARIDEKDRDVFDIYLTGGSNGSAPKQYVGTVFDTLEGPGFEVGESK